METKAASANRVTVDTVTLPLKTTQSSEKPETSCCNDCTIQVTAVVANKVAFKRECEMIFPGIDMMSVIAIPTMQRAQIDLMRFGSEVEDEKDRLLESFFQFAEVFCKELIGQGYWADYIDPNSGLPMLTKSGNKVFDEVESARVLLNYRVTSVGSCRVILHPDWGSSVCPATIFTTAPEEAVINAIEARKVAACNTCDDCDDSKSEVILSIDIAKELWFEVRYLMETKAVSRNRVLVETLTAVAVNKITYKRECELVFPGIDVRDIIAIPTMQRPLFDLVRFGPEVEDEKDRLLESFFQFAETFCKELISQGYWADYIDPSSGLPMLTKSGNKVFNEVESAQVLLNYRIMNAGNCRVLLHPDWGAAVYPATMFTTAPEDVVKVSINKRKPPGGDICDSFKQSTVIN